MIEQHGNRRMVLGALALMVELLVGGLAAPAAAVTLDDLPDADITAEPPRSPLESPLAYDDAYRVGEDGVLRRDSVAGVLANDVVCICVPLRPVTLTARLVAEPAKGQLALNADGSFVYKPKRNFHGTDRFTYEVTDAQGFADRATVTIKVLARPG